MLIDNETGQALLKDMPEHLLAKEKVERGKLSGLGDISRLFKPFLWSLPWLRKIPKSLLNSIRWESLCCLSESGEHRLRTVEGGGMGGSCGVAFMFPYKALRLSEQTRSGDAWNVSCNGLCLCYGLYAGGRCGEDTIEVNRPLKISGGIFIN